MKTQKIFVWTAILVLWIPLIGAFGPAVQVASAASAVQGQLLTGSEKQSNALYFNSVTQYTYSLNGIVQQSSTPPAEADWATPSKYYAGAYFHQSWNEEFTYSNFGQISQTSNPMSIPATAAWVTLSSFQVETSEFQHKIIEPKFRYSLNGIDVLTASNVSDIPPNALWATIYEFSEGWSQRTQNPSFASYSLKRPSPVVQTLRISSGHGHAGYAKDGDEVSLTLETDIPIAQPTLKIGGVEADVSGSGTSWTGTLRLSSATGDGELSVLAIAYAVSGSPGQIATGTTDSSKVIKDTTSPLLSTSPDSEEPTRDDVLVFINAEDAGSGLAEVKWAAGSLAAADFATQGETLNLNDLSFYAEENGTYSVYARDLAGNETVTPVQVSTIDRIKPTVRLTPSTTDPTGEPVTVKVEVEDAESGVDEVRWSDREPQPDSPWKSQDVQDGQFTAAANGTYTVIAWDRAGNETIQKLVISNIRSTNANLDQLSVSNGQQALTLTPAFDPEQTNYQASAANSVSSISLSAAAGEQGSVVSVNGQTLASGTPKSVNLAVGANLITITVTAPLTTVKKTYTLTVTRAAGAAAGVTPAPSSPVSDSSVPSPSVNASPDRALSAFNIELNGRALNEQASREWVGTASSSANGALEYEVQAANIAETLAQAPKGVISELILKRNPQAASVEAVTLRLSEQAQKQLKDGQIQVKLDLGGVQYQLPPSMATEKGDGLSLRIHLLPSTDSEKLLQTVSSSLKQDWKPVLIGTAFSFSSNGRPSAGEAAWTLPLPAGFDQRQLSQLAVFVEKADGQRSIQQGTIQRDAQGRATGVAVGLEGGGWAALLQADPIITEQSGYVQGVSPHSFAPNRAVTRAELAALLNKLSGPSAAVWSPNLGASFRDLPQTSWAASSVARVTEAGWMSGGSDERFRPNDALTRGELAVVLTRWKPVQASGLPSSFTDSIPSWASEAAASAEQAGWMKGYADGSFRPNQSVTRAEAIVTLNRVLQRPALKDSGIAPWPDVPGSHWASGDIRSASRTIEIRSGLNGKVEVSAK